MGDRKAWLDNASTLISSNMGNILTKSSYYETAAWGKTDQPQFINQVVKIVTSYSPIEILDIAQQIELELERERKEKWGPRTVDIDILFFGYEVWNTDRLTIPHPLIQKRRFVLQPMSDIGGAFVHPVLRKSINTLLKQCSDTMKVNKIYE